MKWLFWLLVLFALAAAVALGLRINDGYVLIVFPPWRIDVSLNLLLVFLAGAFTVFYLVVRAIGALLGLPARVSAYRARLAREKGQQVFFDAFRLLFEGRFGQAMKKAGEAHDNGVAPGLAALIAARAAQRMRRPEDQQAWLERATLADRQAQAPRLMLEAEMHIESRDFEAAIAALETLQKAAGRHLAALRLELRARQGAGQWPQVLKLARQLEKRSALPPEVAGELKLRAHLENVAERRADTRALLAYLRDVPVEESSGRLVVAVAQALLELGAGEEASRVIEAQLARDWDDEVVRLYGRCLDGRTTARIAEGEKWLQKHPDDAQLLLALGRLCVHQRLWGKAESYLEASLSVEETRSAHLELAHLFDQLGRKDEADRRYRRAAETCTARD